MFCRLNPESFFVRQNTWVKLCILIIGSVAALAVTVKILIVLLTLTLVYFLITPAIYRCLLQGIRMLLPFMAAYSLTAIILGETIDRVGVLLLRISILVFFVTYISSSFYISRFLEDTHSGKSSKQLKTAVFYAVATLTYIKKFMRYFSDTARNSIQNIADNQTITSKIIDAIHTNWEQRKEIETETEKTLARDYQKPAFLTKYNLGACIYLTLLILSLAV